MDRLEKKEAGKKSSGNKASIRIAISAIMIALGVILSAYPGAIPIGPTKVFPFQHMINGIAGFLLGPFYAGGIALAIGILRIGIGTGTVFAIFGGVPGALVVGFVCRYLVKRPAISLVEPLGTAFGALISAFFVAPVIGAGPLPPFLGISAQWALFTIFFLMSSIPGSILGYLVLIALKRRGMLESMQN
uniref:Energy coupling factor transporter S component ThiW n=1 Tax=Candidatus Methanomethylicus mesodigestus TaxID=1867258 RepID=A0A7C3EWG2_9CREN